MHVDLTGACAWPCWTMSISVYLDELFNWTNSNFEPCRKQTDTWLILFVLGFFYCRALLYVKLLNREICVQELSFRLFSKYTYCLWIHSFTKVKTYRLLCELHFLCCRYKMWNWNVHYSVLISVTDQSTVYLWSLLITLIKIALCGPGAIPLILSLCNLLLYLLVSFTFTFLTCFIYFLAFISLPILPE